MAGFAIRSRFTGHARRSAETCHALRLNPDHPIGSGQGCPGQVPWGIGPAQPQTARPVFCARTVLASLYRDPGQLGQARNTVQADALASTAMIALRKGTCSERD